jgi:1-acyl-sn-glycerol-3-phosphate acyltransferase
LRFILILIARILILLVSRLRIVGRENIPLQGPFILVSNHLSVSDPVLLGANLGRRVIFMAKEELFRNRFISFIIRRFGAFPVYRKGSARDALREASSVLRQGTALGMFPEGKRSLDDTLHPALFGSALIAVHNKSLILPVAITGSETIRGFKWVWHRPKVTILIGRPFCLPETGQALTKARLSEYTGIIMQHIAELLPAKYRGEYQCDKRDADEDPKS